MSVAFHMLITNLFQFRKCLHLVVVTSARLSLLNPWWKSGSMQTRLHYSTLIGRCGYHYVSSTLNVFTQWHLVLIRVDCVLHAVMVNNLPYHYDNINSNNCKVLKNYKSHTNYLQTNR